MIRARRTTYQGITFRSRLEARWAQFMDLLAIPWEYEKELVDLDSLRYLPDFHLPSFNSWLEIKGEIHTDEVGLTIVTKCEQLAKKTDMPVILAFHDPMAAECAVFFPTGEMYSPAFIGMCPLCGHLGVNIRQGADHFVLCPHPNAALTKRTELAHRRAIYLAAQKARATNS